MMPAEVRLVKADGLPVLTVRLPVEMKVLATTVRNGAYSVSDALFMVQVPITYNRDDPEAHLDTIVGELGLPSSAIGFMTAADIKRVLSTTREEYNGARVTCIATAGVKNAVMAGELIPDSVRGLLNEVDRPAPGTINIIVILDAPLHDVGMANALLTITEAKTAAMMDTHCPGTGTTSDAVAICCPAGEGSKYAGTASDVGIAIARAVRKAVAEAILKWAGNGRGKDFIELLAAKGVGKEDMWQAAEALVCPNPDWPEEMLRERFMARLEVLRRDVNVNAMVHAAVLIEEAGYRGHMYGLTAKEFEDDPVHLVADEMMGIALVNYIEGTKGLFDYIRYDKKKPGILSRLGPFLDDLVGALIGGIMSRVYSDLLEGEQ
jgi:alpha-ribazole phosphatase CobZ